MNGGAFVRASKQWAAGIVVSTPVIALLQGALMLNEYRVHHGHAPRPDVPSHGIVVAAAATGNNNNNNAPDEGGGLVIARGSVAHAAIPKKTNHNHHNTTKPLRILVIGDSLAAGVGIRESSTPILPASIAQAISQALAGRALYWTCVGTPGVSSTLLVQDIYQMNTSASSASSRTSRSHLSSSRILLMQRWKQWQKESQERLEAARESAREWWEHRQDDEFSWDDEHDDDDDDDDNTKENSVEHRQQRGPIKKKKKPNRTNEVQNPVQRWWKRVRRDVDGLRRVVQTTFSKHKKDDASALTEAQTHPILPEQQQQDENSTPPTLRRYPSVDPAVVGHYDIAIVLTGLNDLKDEFLPFMMSEQYLHQVEESKKLQASNAAATTDQRHGGDGNDKGADSGGGGGIQQALVRILHALEGKMKIRVPGLNDEQQDDSATENGQEEQPPDPKSELTTTATASSSSSSSRIGTNQPPAKSKQQQQQQQGHHKDAPMVVFPALPIAPIEMTRVAPLGWFLVPIISAMDHHKRLLAQLYPGLVVFVDSPSTDVLSQVEARRGPLWDELNLQPPADGHVLLELTDVVATVRDRIQDLMKQHYQSWFLDADEAAAAAAADDDEDSIYATTQYEIELDGVSLTTALRRGELGRNHPGATMISCDGIHPSDKGYEFWGRYIAAEIIRNMDISK